MQINRLFNRQNLSRLLDARNIGLYVFLVILLAISWSTVKTIQINYGLQKKISLLSQQNQVLKLANENTDLKNKYYATNEYLDLAARQSLGLAAPGEKVLLIPHDVAAKYVDIKTVNQITQNQPEVKRSKITKNLQDWRDFLLGRKLFAGG